jgi:hypothetical protein
MLILSNGDESSLDLGGTSQDDNFYWGVKGEKFNTYKFIL